MKQCHAIPVHTNLQMKFLEMTESQVVHELLSAWVVLAVCNFHVLHVIESVVERCYPALLGQFDVILPHEVLIGSQANVRFCHDDAPALTAVAAMMVNTDKNVPRLRSRLADAFRRKWQAASAAGTKRAASVIAVEAGHATTTVDLTALRLRTSTANVAGTSRECSSALRLDACLARSAACHLISAALDAVETLHAAVLTLLELAGLAESMRQNRDELRALSRDMASNGIILELSTQGAVSIHLTPHSLSSPEKVRPAFCLFRSLHELLQAAALAL
mmetsp:Transcript_71826/g.126864  ORF Transcript_71826/g.126864 Transcript_71826/m.126864 type:complete len:276 (+) Transcript_71826:696-1523(+)